LCCTIERLEIVDGKLPHSVVDRGSWQLRIEPLKRCTEIAGEHRLSGVLAAEHAVRPEGLIIPGIGALPTEIIPQVLGESALHQHVFAIDRRPRHVSRLRVS
jgi:hypothetical protein